MSKHIKKSLFSLFSLFSSVQTRGRCFQKRTDEKR
jgi:hypothetical protein